MLQNILNRIFKPVRKHPGESILVVLSLIGILWCLIRMSRPLQTWDFSRDNLLLSGEGISFEAGTIAENDPGWYVDNSMAYGDPFVQTPPVDLPVGSYEFTLTYQTDADGSSYSFNSTDSSYRILLGRNNETLEIGKREKVLTNCYTMEEPGFYVSIRYGGNGYLIVNGISIRQTRALERIILCIILFLWLLYFCCRKLQNKGKLSGFLFAACVAMIVQIPYLSMYLYQGDDLSFHLLRIQGIADGLRCGQFPVRIQPTWLNGYGYAVSIFYSDAVLFPAGILRLIGFSLQTSYKIYVYGISFLTCSIAAYSFRRICNDAKIAAIGSILYTLAPYRLLNIFCRGGIGEFTALTFLPLIFVGFYEILAADKGKNKNSWLLLTLGMSGIIQSHILTCEIVVLFLGITCLLFLKKLFMEKRIFLLIKAAVTTALLNLWFLVPFMDYYMHETLIVNSETYKTPIQTGGVFISQLLEIFPRYTGVSVSILEGLKGNPERSFAIGFVFILAIGGFIYERFHQIPEQRKSPDIKLGWFCTVSGLLLLFMSTVWFPWDYLYRQNRLLHTLISMLQFPWRLLGMTALLFSIVACILLQLCKKHHSEQHSKSLSTLFLCFAIMAFGSFTGSLLTSDQFTYVPDTETIGTFELVSAEYLPLGFDWGRSAVPEEKIWHNDSISVAAFEKTGTNCRMTINNPTMESQYVELPLLFYRGYQAVDEKTHAPIHTDSGENCRVRFLIDAGYQGTVSVQFHEPVLWRVPEIVSIVVLSLLLFILLKREKRIY